MTKQEFYKLNVYDKVKVIMNQPLSELECRDQALGVLEGYYEDFGFDEMENQVNMMADAYELIVEESGLDYGGVEMQRHVSSEAIALRQVANNIRRLSKEYREEMMQMLRDFKADSDYYMQENSYDEESTDNPELNESIQKIKSNFKRFL
jgi:hypothetical protein